MHQMRIPLQQPLPLPQRLAHLPDVPMFEVAQASMNDAGRTAGRAGGEIVLLDQKRAPSGASTFASDGDSVNSAADYNHVETLVLERWSRVHAGFRCVAIGRAGRIGGYRFLVSSICVRHRKITLVSVCGE